MENTQKSALPCRLMSHPIICPRHQPNWPSKNIVDRYYYEPKLFPSTHGHSCLCLQVCIQTLKAAAPFEGSNLFALSLYLPNKIWEQDLYENTLLVAPGLLWFQFLFKMNTVFPLFTQVSKVSGCGLDTSECWEISEQTRTSTRPRACSYTFRAFLQTNT